MKCLLQGLELSLGVGQLVQVEVELPQVLAGAAMPGIDLEGLQVRLLGLVVAAELAIAVAEPAVSVRVVRRLLDRFRKVSQGGLEILRVDGLSRGGDVGILGLSWEREVGSGYARTQRGCSPRRRSYGCRGWAR